MHAHVARYVKHFIVSKVLVRLSKTNTIEVNFVESAGHEIYSLRSMIIKVVEMFKGAK